MLQKILLQELSTDHLKKKSHENQKGKKVFTMYYLQPSKVSDKAEEQSYKYRQP